MKLQRSNQQSLVLKENAPLLIILASILVIGIIAIGTWSILTLNNSEETVNEFENEVNSLVESVQQEPDEATDSGSEDSFAEGETEELATGSNPFKTPLERVNKTKDSDSAKKSNGNDQDEKPVKERIGDQVNVLGLLGSADKRLAIIKVNNEVQIVKPGDRISSLIIKDINSDRILAEEYGEELTYTFGGGQD